MAGSYSTAPFIHPFTFTVDAGWSNDRAWAHGGEISIPALNEFIEWGTGFTGGMPGAKFGTSAELLAYIGSIKGWTATPAAPVTIGSKTGSFIDVASNKTRVNPLLTIPEDHYGIAPGEKMRVMAFDVDGGVVMLMVEVGAAKDFDTAVASVQPILDSIVWR